MVNAVFGFNKFYLWVRPLYKADHLWRVHRSEVHVSLELYASQLCDMKERLTVFASAESKVIPPLVS